MFIIIIFLADFWLLSVPWWQERERCASGTPSLFFTSAFYHELHPTRYEPLMPRQFPPTTTTTSWNPWRALSDRVWARPARQHAPSEDGRAVETLTR